MVIVLEIESEFRMPNVSQAQILLVPLRNMRFTSSLFEEKTIFLRHAARHMTAMHAIFFIAIWDCKCW